jgi:hypothetical protein
MVTSGVVVNENEGLVSSVVEYLTFISTYQRWNVTATDDHKNNFTNVSLTLSEILQLSEMPVL